MFVKNKKGFTLIEIVAALIILAVLFALVIPKFINMDGNANNQTEEFMDKAVERLAIQEYHALNISGVSLDDYIEKRIEEEKQKRNK